MGTGEVMEKLGKFDAVYNLLKCLVGTVPEGSSILEVGCGGGLRTIELKREFSVHITLSDISSSAIDTARDNASTAGVGADFEQADALALPFEDNSFDIVWSGGVNEHFIDPQRQTVFNEMARVCRHECIVIVPNAWNVFYWLWRVRLELQKKWIYGFELPFSTFELKRRMEDAGLIFKKAGRTFPYGMEIGIRGIKE